MKFESKFNIDDVLMMKFERMANDSFTALIVMEIFVDCCYGGVQIFYRCRLVHGRKKADFLNKSIKDSDMEISHGINASTPFMKYREDELKPATKEIIQILFDK